MLEDRQNKLTGIRNITRQCCKLAGIHTDDIALMYARYTIIVWNSVECTLIEILLLSFNFIGVYY